jgi:hypothetical protein
VSADCNCVIHLAHLTTVYAIANAFLLITKQQLPFCNDSSTDHHRLKSNGAFFHGSGNRNILVAKNSLTPIGRVA